MVASARFPGRLTPSATVRRFRPGSLGWSVLALVLVNDYQLRIRSGEQSLQGSIDLQVALEIAVYGMVGAYALSRLRHGRRGRPRPLAVALGGYGIAVCFSVVYSPVPSFAVVRAGQLIACLALAYATYRTADRRDVHRMIHSLVALVLASVAWGVAMPVTYSELHVGRFTWWNLHPNTAGNLLALAVVAVAVYLLDRSLAPFMVAPRRAYGVVLAVLGVALIATESRSSLMGALTAVAFVGLVTRTRRRQADFVLLMVIGAALVGLVGNQSVETYIERGDAESLTTLNSRTDLWGAAVDMIAESPVIGHGFAAARRLFTEEFGGVGGAHNALLEVMIDSGALGVLAWLTVVIGAFGAAWPLLPQRRAGHGNDAPHLLGFLVTLILPAITSQGLGQVAATESVFLLILTGVVLGQSRIRPAGRGPVPGAMSDSISASMLSSR